MPLLWKSHIRAIYGWDPVLFFNSIKKGFKLHKISSSLVIRNDGFSKPANVDHLPIIFFLVLHFYLTSYQSLTRFSSVAPFTIKKDSGACPGELSLAWLFDSFIDFQTRLQRFRFRLLGLACWLLSLATIFIFFFYGSLNSHPPRAFLSGWWGICK